MGAEFGWIHPEASPGGQEDSMDKKRIAIFYETSEGHTAQVAGRMKQRLEGEGHTVNVAQCRQASHADIEQADIVLIGGSIHAGKHHAKVVAFAEKHAQLLNAKPAAFFLVCLTAHSEKPEAPRTVANYLATFEKATGWKPKRSQAFAGALLYTQYGIIKRKIMEAINRQEGGETDTSRDHVYTNWQAVEDWASEVGRL